MLNFHSFLGPEEFLINYTCSLQQQDGDRRSHGARTKDRNPGRPINQKPRCWPDDKIETFDLAPEKRRKKKRYERSGGDWPDEKGKRNYFNDTMETQARFLN